LKGAFSATSPTTSAVDAPGLAWLSASVVVVAGSSGPPPVNFGAPLVPGSTAPALCQGCELGIQVEHDCRAVRGPEESSMRAADDELRAAVVVDIAAAGDSLAELIRAAGARGEDRLSGCSVDDIDTCCPGRADDELLDAIARRDRRARRRTFPPSSRPGRRREVMSVEPSSPESTSARPASPAVVVVTRLAASTSGVPSPSMSPGAASDQPSAPLTEVPARSTSTVPFAPRR
jgi:hypothetical protein